MKRVLLTSLLLLVSACSRSSSQEELSKALQTIQSWTATAQMVGETWQHEAVPDQYAQQTLAKSQHEIDQEMQGVSMPSDLQQQLHQVQQTIQQMTTAVEQKNKGAIAPPLQALAKEQQQLTTFATAYEKQL